MKIPVLLLTFILFAGNGIIDAQVPGIKLEQFKEDNTNLNNQTENHHSLVNENSPTTHNKKGEKPLRWHFGVTAGYRHSGNNWLTSVSGIYYNYDDRTRTSPGFAAGGVVSYKIDDVLSFDTGLNVAMWGFGYDTSDLSTRFTRYALEIPTQITFFEPDAIVPIFVQLGCVTGLNLGGSRSITTTRQDSGIENPPSRVFSIITFGLSAAIGYGPVSVQYTHNVTGSMSNLFRRYWDYSTDSTLERHNAWGVTIAYTYWF